MCRQTALFTLTVLPLHLSACSSTTYPFLFLPPRPLTYNSSFLSILLYSVSLAAPFKRLMTGILATSLFSSVLTGQQSDCSSRLQQPMEQQVCRPSGARRPITFKHLACSGVSRPEGQLLKRMTWSQQTIQCWSERFSISNACLLEAVPLTSKSTTHSRPS